MRFKWKKKWTDEELDLAQRLRTQGIELVKDHLCQKYRAYRNPYDYSLVGAYTVNDLIAEANTIDQLKQQLS